MKHLGERLKKLRKDNRITQEALAEYLGISYQAVSKWENGQGFPDISLLPALSNFFGVSSDYLLGIESEKSEERIEHALAEARKTTHTGEIEKSIDIIENALKSFPNEHRLLCDLLEYKVMRFRDDPEWLKDIEIKARLILKDCHVDEIRHKTIGHLAFAYSYSGKHEKSAKTIALLPEMPYSKKRLISLTAPEREQAKYKPECILKETKLLIADILTVARHNTFWGDPKISVDICKRALAIIGSIGSEGHLLYLKADVYRNLMLAYAKLKEAEEMYRTADTLLFIYDEIEATLSCGETAYHSNLLEGLTFSRETVIYKSSLSEFEFYHHFLTNAKLLHPYTNEERFTKLLRAVNERIKTTNT